MGAAGSVLGLVIVGASLLYKLGEEEINSSLMDSMFPRDYYIHQVMARGWQKLKREVQGYDVRRVIQFIRDLIEFLSK